MLTKLWKKSCLVSLKQRTDATSAFNGSLSMRTMSNKNKKDDGNTTSTGQQTNRFKPL